MAAQEDADLGEEKVVYDISPTEAVDGSIMEQLKTATEKDSEMQDIDESA